MNNFIISDNDDIDMILIKYTESYLKELNYYGSSKTKQLLLLLGLSSEISQMEKKIFNTYDNYVSLVLNDITNPNIYYLHKIFFVSTNLIIKMIMFYVMVLEQTDTEEFIYKSKYLVGSLENYIDKIIVPIESELKNILDSNKIFNLEYSTKYLKEFIKINKNKFNSKKNIYKLNNLINILDNI
jgi:hypothetical protein